ncbi:MAG: hypothetical protein IKZ49_00640 [Alphaproteobacteria bacterium]|nr:hypothetical protein [Alphaproteobacteria bacterium]
MILNHKILIALLLCMPYTSYGMYVDGLKNNILSKTSFQEAASAYEEAVNTVINDNEYKDVPESVKAEHKKSVQSNISDAKKGQTEAPATNDNDSGTQAIDEDTRTAEQKKQDLEDKKKAYEDAKATEQSTANKTLTALTTAATGIGGMELAMGLSEKKSDEAAEQDMKAYLLTFRCTYANGKNVKGGPDEIELPGGNDEKLMSMRSEYVALAADLKERKEALGMKPGIEAEKIYDKAEMGLYDDENVGLTSGTYESLYRAQALGSEEDQAKLDAQHKEAKNRMIAGGVLVGAGVIGGIVGNSLINGKLGEKIKEAKAKKEQNSKQEDTALTELQKCLDKAGVKNTSKLTFEKFTPSILNLDNIDCSKDLKMVKGKEATSLFVDTDDSETIVNKLNESFSTEIANKMLGISSGCIKLNEEMGSDGVCRPKTNTTISTNTNTDADTDTETEETLTTDNSAKLAEMKSKCVPTNTVIEDAYHEVNDVGFCYIYDYNDKEKTREMCNKMNVSLCEYQSVNGLSYVCSSDCSSIPTNFYDMVHNNDDLGEWEFLK